MAASRAWCLAQETLRRRIRRMSGFHSLSWSAAKDCCCVSCNHFLEPEPPWSPPNSMLAEKVDPAPISAAEHRASFFRQSGWLMIATVGGGVFMLAVHLLAHKMPKGDYGEFVAFLSVTMFIPAMPLQMVLAQQTARALALHREHELSGLIRAAWLGTFLVWLVAVVVVLLFQGKIDRKSVG